MFPGSYELKAAGHYQGRCPGENLHTGGSASTDARIFVEYGPQGQAPGIYCLHNSCAGYLHELNEAFRGELFKRDPNAPKRVSDGVAMEPKRRDHKVPKYDAGKLAAVVKAAPVAASRPEYFMERSPVDPRGVDAAGFLDLMFSAGDRVLVFTDMRSQGDFLHEVGKGSYRLGAERGVTAVESALPSRGAEGVWYLNQPVTGKWVPNREGKYSRRSEDNVCAWKHWVIESDEAPEDLWLRFLSICPLPVKAIYSSGGRSWHVLARCEYRTKGEMDGELTRAKRSLSILGADAGALTALRLTRLPGCKRGMREQRLIYVDPGGDGGLVSLRPKVRSV